jgi:tetratricopeptide (TPR) repeat protein
LRAPYLLLTSQGRSGTPDYFNLDFFEDLKYADTWQLKLKYLTTGLFGARNLQLLTFTQKGANPETLTRIDSSYTAACQAILHFFQGQLGDNASAMNFFVSPPDSLGRLADFFSSWKSRKGLKPPPDSDEFIEEARQSGIAQAIAQFRSFRQLDPHAVLFEENSIISLGYELLGQNRTQEAIQVFLMAAEAYPNSYNSFDSLAEAYMKNGETDMAIHHYRKSLQLNPKNTNALQKLLVLTKDAPPKP